MAKLKGTWQKGRITDLSADEFAEKVKISRNGVKKPTALEERKNKWRIIHKPILPGEFFD